MSNMFTVADPHFGHLGVCKFTRADGVTPLRPWSDPDEMDEALVKMWNEVVGPRDRVNILGDVVINRRCFKTLGRLNGRLRLVAGNHDVFRLQEYLKYFDDIRAYQVEDGIIMSHIPIHPMSMERFGCNVHGHLHEHRVRLDDGTVDPRYLCVSMEQVGSKPIAWEDVKTLIVAQGGVAGLKERIVGPGDRVLNQAD